MKQKYQSNFPRTALTRAAQLASDLHARIRVIVTRAVPYPLSLDNPPVSMRFDRERVLAFVNSHTNDASLLMCYCRDEVQALNYLLEANPHFSRLSPIIIIAGKQPLVPDKGGMHCTEARGSWARGPFCQLSKRLRSSRIR